VRGRVQDRVNHGRLGPKDLFGWQSVDAPDRLRTPWVREDGRLREATWDEAMTRIVDRVERLVAEQGPSAIGFYTSGQLFLEEYYTLALVARGGIGTPHLDGNTRLCTATAGEALKESFGCDGQPGSYTDVDHADALALFGHNVAETQTVLWSRMLDRLAGANPPALLCVDPRPTPAARVATVHLAPLPATNVALMNGLLHEVVARGWVDEAYVDAHTLGYDDLARCVADYPVDVVARICDVPADELRRAAELVGTAPRLLSTVLQGFYQSSQATAAAVQVNNLHLLRGMLGRPGCGVLQMNGQPTAQNTRECGANGDLPGFRNWANEDHVEELARLWNVPAERIPHVSAPTHAMAMFRYAEQGTLRMLWVQATNPAVSLPELARIRSVLADDGLFLVVQDLYRTETAELADVVLPAAGWAEKTGTFTNADRTVHLSEQAVDPPGEARSDLAIFVDLARRLDLRDANGAPLVSWDTPEGAFDAWKACSRGRPCDYSGLTYERLRGSGGIQWPCTPEEPEGRERLYGDGVFPTTSDLCETFGRDLVTGAPTERTAYEALAPAGRAFLKAAPYVPARERPSERYPLHLITGRTLYHFHTRTKTARAPQLDAAAPEVWVELSVADAHARQLAEGDVAEVVTPRGRVEACVRITALRDGVVFLPFHYGYWDDDGDAHDRAANELTRTAWDAVSKQPLFKSGAAQVTRVAAGDGPSAAPTTTASAPVDATVTATRGGGTAESEDVVMTEVQP